MVSIAKKSRVRGSTVIVGAMALAIACLFYFAFGRKSVEPPTAAVPADHAIVESVKQQHPPQRLPSLSSPVQWADLQGVARADIVAQPSGSIPGVLSVAPPVADPPPAASHLLLVNALHRPEVLCPALRRIRAAETRSAGKVHSKMVLMHAPDATSRALLQRALQPDGACHDAVDGGVIELFTDLSVTMLAPTYFPLIAAAAYVRKVIDAKQGERASERVLYINPTEVSYCGDVFELMTSHRRVYGSFSAKWGYQQDKPVASLSPFVLGGGSLPAFAAFAGSLAADLRARLAKVDDNRQPIGKVLIELKLLRVPGAEGNSAEGLLPPDAPTWAAGRLVSFPAPAVLPADEAACALADFEPSACRNAAQSQLMMVVDQHRCARGADEAVLSGFCPSQWQHDFYVMPRTVIPASSAMIDILRRGKPAIVEALDGVRNSDDHRRLRDTTTYETPRQAQYAHCPGGRPSAVVGLAAGYTAAQIRLFLSSFYVSVDSSCTELVLFVKEIPEGLEEKHRAATTWVLTSAYPATVRTCDAIVEQRVEMYRQWLLAAPLRYCMLLLSDVRDVFFQADPFRDLLNVSTSRFAKQLLASEEFLFISPESYTMSTWSAYSIWPHYWFSTWQSSMFGSAFRDAMFQRTFNGATLHRDGVTAEASSGEPMPIICSGLYAGTAKALLVAFDAMLAVFRVTPCWFGADQAILTGMVSDGFRYAGYPYDIIVANPEYSPYHNGVERHTDVLWRKEPVGMFVNCDGQPYSAVHQVDEGRHPWLHGQVLARVQGCPLPMAQFRPARRVVEQPLAANPHVLRGLPKNADTPNCPSPPDAAQTPPPAQSAATGAAQVATDVVLLHAVHWGAVYIQGAVTSIRTAGCTALIVLLAPHAQAYNELTAEDAAVWQRFAPLRIEQYAGACTDARERGLFWAALQHLRSKRQDTYRFVVVMDAYNTRWHRNLLRELTPGTAMVARNPTHAVDLPPLRSHFSPFTLCGLELSAAVDAEVQHAERTSGTPLRFASFRGDFVAGSAAPVLDLLEALIDFGGYTACSSHAALNTYAHRHGLPPTVVVSTAEAGPVVSFAELCNGNAAPFVAQCRQGNAPAVTLEHQCLA